MTPETLTGLSIIAGFAALVFFTLWRLKSGDCDWYAKDWESMRDQLREAHEVNLELIEKLALAEYREARNASRAFRAASPRPPVPMSWPELQSDDNYAERFTVANPEASCG